MTERAVPELPSADLERTFRFYRYFGFEAVSRSDTRLLLRRESVELSFYLTDLDWTQPGFARVHRGCTISVESASDWHARFAGSRMSWKPFTPPTLTAVSTGAWDRPAFAFTDKDGNLIW